jgi:sulfite reductase (NADPH) flavoprotein alpha-component
VLPNPEFRPKPGKTPIILIGAGTGIGPLAGFVRHNQQHRPMHMYFGARDPSSDFLYEKELRGWLADKRLTKLYVAFSRITQHRAYVQDHVRADREAILRLMAKGGQIMVCGGRDMATGVQKALNDILAPLNTDVAALKRAGLYLEDVY